MGRVVLVPTPIGNLQDMTLRALEELKAADAIAAEDTRHTRKLLDHYGIDKPLLRLDAHTTLERAPGVLDRYPNLAFVSDAGTPGISDPGAELVRVALARGDEVDVLPGPTSFVPALVLSGLPLARFTFEGFLPRKGGGRSARLEAIAASEATSVLFESPRRVVDTLVDLGRACGPERPASVSREISKRFQTTYRGTLRKLAEELGTEEVKGEVVIVVAGREPLRGDEAEADFRERARALAAEGVSGKELRKALTALGVPRNVAYRLSLEHEGAEAGP